MESKTYFRLNDQHEAIANMIYELDSSLHPERRTIKEKYLQDTKYTLRFLALAVDLNEPLLFDNYMQWFGKLAQYLSFHLDTLQTHFEATKQVLREVLITSEFESAYKIYHKGIDLFIHAFQTVVKHDFNVNSFLDALLQMDIEQANQIIQDRLASGASIQFIYLNIIQPTMYTVGELWQQQKITVAKEHYITAAVQNIRHPAVQYGSSMV